MKFITNINVEEYDEFIENNPYKSHFLQSSLWGEFSKQEKDLIPHYVGIKENNKIICATLLLEKKLFLGYSYFYAPRGYVINFNDEELLKLFTTELQKYMKKNKGIFLKIDPDIIYKKYNYLDKLIEDDNKIYNSLIGLGYKHLGFTKRFETTEPRYTFRIDFNQEFEDIEEHFSKTTKQRINKAEKLGCEVSIGSIDDIDTFYHLMTLTENRKDFISYSKDYYKEQFKMLIKEDMAVLFLGRVNTKKIIDNLKLELNETNASLNEIDTTNNSKSNKNKIKTLTDKILKIEKEITKYTKYQKEYGQVITLNAHMIIKYNDKAWVLYAGNHNILTESYANYLTYFEHIKYCKENNIKIYDQFGTIGDLSKDNPRLGLHEFKKKFGGDYIEFLGEFDYVLKPFMYFVFTKLVPIYRNLVRSKGKREVNNEIKRNK